MIIPSAKPYEKPDSGVYHAVLADIIDLGTVTTVYQGQAKTYPAVRFIWFLNVLGKDQVKFPDTFGKPLRAQQKFNVTSLHEKSNVYKTLKQILGYPPPVGFDIEGLIGQTRQLLINREISPDGQKDFANVMGILPAQPGIVVPIPGDYIRDKFRPKTVAGPQGQPVQTYATAPPAQNVQYQQPQATQQYTPPPTVPVQPPPFAPPPVASPQQFHPAPAPQGADIKF